MNTTRPRTPVVVDAKVSPVAAQALATLDQCAALVQGVSDQCYTAPSKVLEGGTLGKHVRHALDHYKAALDSTAGKVIDYDHRERDVPMETSRDAALSAVTTLQDRLSRLSDAELSRPVRIMVMLAGDGTLAELGSTLGRELAFASHHAIHHHAMMKAIAAEHGVRFAQDFGKAPSTINFERSRA